MTREQYHLHLVETLHDLTDHGFALLSRAYPDNYPAPLLTELLP